MNGICYNKNVRNGKTRRPRLARVSQNVEPFELLRVCINAHYGGTQLGGTSIGFFVSKNKTKTRNKAEINAETSRHQGGKKYIR